MAATRTRPERLRRYSDRAARASHLALRPARPPLVSLGEAGVFRIVAMIKRRELAQAHAILRALPPATPELPRLMGCLITAMARASMYQDVRQLLAAMLTQFPPRPEVTETLIAVAVILSRQGLFEETFAALGHTVAESYGVDESEMTDLMRRLARACRRQGQRVVAVCMMDTWLHPAAA